MGIMASSPVHLLLQLLLVSLALASHHFGGTVTFAYKGRNPDGSFRVDLRNRATYDGCQYSHNWQCFSGNCGTNSLSQRGVLDKSTNAPQLNNQWCETETYIRRNVPNDKPFQMRANSCCWVPTRTSGWSASWALMTHVDLGTRSDTGEPNRSPDVAILPFLRVPQNCPRTYKLMSFDPDGDQVRCRYGNLRHFECSTCNQPVGFHLDQDSCTLHYRYAIANPRVFAFEMVVEDYPQRHISLAYTDGSRAYRAPLTLIRGKRQSWSGSTTFATTTAAPPTTPSYWWWYWWHQTTTTTAAPTTTTPNWWWWHHTTTTSPTTNTTTPTPTPSTTTSTTTITPTTTSTTTPTTTSTTITTTTPTTTSTTITTPTTTSTTTPTTTSTTITTTTPTTTSTTITTPTTTSTTTPTTTSTTITTPTTTSTTITTTTPTTTSTTITTTTPTTTSTTITTPTTTSTTTPTTTSTTITTPTATNTRSTTTSSLYSSTAPLSKLPLQFSVLVDPPVASCQEGHYLPKFVPPTPANGARIQAEVHKELEIRVKAQAAYAVIYDIIISGPLNISKSRTTHDEFVIRWTPTENDLGDHYPICFAVESATGSVPLNSPYTTHSHNHHVTLTSQSGIYQSEMRCVLVDVKKKQVTAHVVCNESTMTVHVDKSSFSILHVDNLRLNDPSNVACSLKTHSNSTHIIGIIPLNACGTQIEEDDDYLYFKNEITTVDNSADLITRKHLLEVDFFCQYPKRGNLTLSFMAHRNNITVWERGFGTFTYQFELYTDSSYRTMKDPGSYPLEYDLGSKIYMEIEATSSINNTKLFVESCRASPYDNPNYHATYSIIENGCIVEPTVKVHTPAHNKQFRFCMEAFKFIGQHDQVYISCSVLMCEDGNSNTRCSRGCVNSTWSGGHHHHHRKREAVIQSVNHFVSQGPLRLRRSAENTAASATNLNLNLVFIAGCALAAIGMVCAVMMYKIKMSKVNYQRLPTYES